MSECTAMKLGFVSAILPELSLEEVLDFAAEAVSRPSS